LGRDEEEVAGTRLDALGATRSELDRHQTADDEGVGVAARMVMPATHVARLTATNVEHEVRGGQRGTRNTEDAHLDRQQERRPDTPTGTVTSEMTRASAQPTSASSGVMSLALQ
jgi:hypothetical protein